MFTARTMFAVRMRSSTDLRPTSELGLLQIKPQGQPIQRQPTMPDVWLGGSEQRRWRGGERSSARFGERLLKGVGSFASCRPSLQQFDGFAPLHLHHQGGGRLTRHDPY